MASVYEIRIFGRDGARYATLTGSMGSPGTGQDSGFSALSYVREVNGVGSGMFVVDAESAVVGFLDPSGLTLLDAQVEFWRSDTVNSVTPYCDFYGFVRDREYITDEDGTIRFVVYLDEQNDYLRRAAIAYRAGIANRTLFSNVPTETILKTLVTRNATSSGTTADGRDRNVDTWGTYISVAADTAAGANLTLSCMGRNLYEVLREVAETGGLDFSLVKTGAQTWEFRTAALLGTDRSNNVTFALNYGNMRRPGLRSNRRSEKTVVVAGGQGIDSTRTIATRTGDNYNAAYNSLELFVNASQYSTTAGLETEADERLEELRARDILSFDVIQVPSTLYGKHYFLGDKVRAYFRGFSYTPQIQRVAVDVRSRGNQPVEQIQVTTANA